MSLSLLLVFFSKVFSLGSRFFKLFLLIVTSVYHPFINDGADVDLISNDD